MCVADALLVLSNAFVIIIGSYSFFKCIRKRGKTVATLARKLAHKKKKEKEEQKAKELEEQKDGQDTSLRQEGKKNSRRWKKNAHAKVHPIMV